MQNLENNTLKGDKIGGYMKKFFFLLLVLIPVFLIAKLVRLEQAQQKAEEFINSKLVENRFESIDEFSNDAAFLVSLSPQGFILISTDDEIHPIMGYSFLNDFTSDPEEMDIISSWLENIHTSYINNLAFPQKEQNRQKWQNFLATTDEFQQWPEAGTTPTGGWLETNWSQGYPYNQFCPLDPENSSRCVAGCPSIVMSQIINFHRQINQTQFTDYDDYHMYNSGANNYIIDDDGHIHGFPSYPELNVFLSDIEAVYAGNNNLSDELVAYLIFACGAAIKQSYSASISGNYYDQQIINGFRRFGFDTAELLWEAEPLVFQRLAENMKVALPARLGILAPSAGHQIVVDGYNTDEEYHFNFGWGGSSNGWYSFPLSGMPYQLNMFGSVDLDINQTWQDCLDFEFISPLAGSVFHQEANLNIQVEEMGTTPIDSLNIFVNNDLFQAGSYPTSLNLPLSILGNGNHKITVVAFAEDKKMRVKTVDFEIARGNVVFEENFDYGWENNWEITSGNIDHTWQILENSLESFSETNSNSIASATCPLAYTNLNEVMVSPEILLPNVDDLEWNFYVGFCDRYPSYPGISAAISTDHGANWIDMWQTSSTIEEWTWKYISLDLTDYAGQTIMIKYTCSGFSYADISIDGICIIEPQDVSTGNELISPNLTLTNHPNPFNPTTTISFELNTEITEDTELMIYNLKGQQIRHFSIFNVQSSIVWNGTDDSGKPVSSGIYFAKLKNNNQQISRKMLLLK
jgi:Peptidase C10 family/Secretion system C-terminal sorting domain/Spi protease inhibitor